MTVNAAIVHQESRKSLWPQATTVIDFLERTIMTALEAGLTCVLIPGDSVPTVRIAFGAAAVSAGKFVLLKVSAWQAAHAS